MSLLTHNHDPLSVGLAEHTIPLVSLQEEDEDDDKLQDKNAGDFQDVKRRVRTAGGGASITVRARAQNRPVL